MLFIDIVYYDLDREENIQQDNKEVMRELGKVVILFSLVIMNDEKLEYLVDSEQVRKIVNEVFEEVCNYCDVDLEDLVNIILNDNIDFRIIREVKLLYQFKIIIVER